MFKLFTHTDMDGYGCAVIANYLLPVDEQRPLSVTYCDYDDIDHTIMDLLNNEDPSMYEKIFITDISVSDDVAKKIDASSFPIVLIDHHQTAMHLDGENPYGLYEWAHVATEEIIYFNEYDDHLPSDTGKASATTLFLTYLNNNYTEEGHEHPDLHPIFTEEGWRSLLTFAEMVRRYDTWEWHTRYQNDRPKQWNDLFKIMGGDYFLDRMIYNSIISLDFTDKEKTILDIEQKRIDAYVEKKDQQLVMLHDVDGYHAGIVFADQYISELGNRLCLNNPDIDFVAMIHPFHSISYRTAKDDVDVSKIAARRGGGGHAKAAGSPMPYEDAPLDWRITLKLLMEPYDYERF